MACQDSDVSDVIVSKNKGDPNIDPYRPQLTIILTLTTLTWSPPQFLETPISQMRLPVWILALIVSDAYGVIAV